jgi:hypothetical protein
VGFGQSESLRGDGSHTTQPSEMSRKLNGCTRSLGLELSLYLVDYEQQALRSLPDDAFPDSVIPTELGGREGIPAGSRMTPRSSWPSGPPTPPTGSAVNQPTPAR